MGASKRDHQDAPTQFPPYSQVGVHVEQQQQLEPMFYYFAYGSCMCPVDLKRSLGEITHKYVIGSAMLKGYRLGFYRKSQLRNCGVLDIVPDATSSVEGVLYQLPWRLSEALDEREEVPRGGYRQEIIEVRAHGNLYKNVRTYVVVDKLPKELAPNDWYFNVVLRGAVTCGLSEEYVWNLFHHMHQLQQYHWQTQSLHTAMPMHSLGNGTTRANTIAVKSGITARRG